MSFKCVLKYGKKYVLIWPLVSQFWQMLRFFSVIICQNSLFCPAVTSRNSWHFNALIDRILDFLVTLVLWNSLFFLRPFDGIRNLFLFFFFCLIVFHYLSFDFMIFLLPHGKFRVCLMNFGSPPSFRNSDDDICLWTIRRISRFFSRPFGKFHYLYP